jgi:microcin C transport system substrate-binding protein
VLVYSSSRDRRAYACQIHDHAGATANAELNYIGSHDEDRSVIELLAGTTVFLNRRDLIKGLTTTALVGNRIIPTADAAPGPASEAPAWTHGISLLGNLKYPSSFVRFDYVNAHPPKAGVVRRAAVGTYDSFNLVVAGVKGDLVAGVDLLYDTLMVPSLDEIASEYGLIAEAVRYPADFSWVSFRLRAAAKWHDRKPISAEDVIFSLEIFKKLHPQLAAYYRHVVATEKISDREVMFKFDKPGIRELPQVIGQLTVLPRHWWEAKDESGKRRDIAQTTLEPPLGSGPYRIKAFNTGQSITYERIADYWGNNLPVNIGTANFQELRFDYFRDPSVALEAFKAGTIDWRIENTAKNWATEYDFPAVADKRVVLEEFPIRSIGTMQAFAFNTRRPKFQDPRVRRAFNFAFNFEQVNREFFFGQYKRIASYFDGTELASLGLPKGRELEFLQAFRSEIPPEVFTTAYWNPVSPNAEAFRSNLLEAKRLLLEAGLKVEDLGLFDPKTGQQFSVEFLIGNESFERIALFFQPALERLGMRVSVRLVDDVQYENRLREWDFDVIVAVWQETLTPGNEQWDYWGSRSADVPGSLNLIGIKNPAVDGLIQRIIFADNRDDLVAACKALDRVLLWNHYVVPQWNVSKVRTARWDRFSHPEPVPKYGLAAFPTLWWWEAGRAAQIE